MFEALKCGNDVVIVKDYKVVGKGRASVQHGNDWVSVQITEGEILESLKETQWYKKITEVVGEKYTYIRYFPLTGLYCCPGWVNDKEICDEVDKLMGPSMACNEFNFDFGIVNDLFKDTEGYGNKRS